LIIQNKNSNTNLRELQIWKSANPHIHLVMHIKKIMQQGYESIQDTFNMHVGQNGLRIWATSSRCVSQSSTVPIYGDRTL